MTCISDGLPSLLRVSTEYDRRLSRMTREVGAVDSEHRRRTERSCCATLSCVSGVQGDGEVHIDPEYRRLSRERHQAAATKTRLMRVIDDPRSATVARNPVPIQIQIGGKRKVRACHFSSAEGDCVAQGRMTSSYLRLIGQHLRSSHEAERSSAAAGNLLPVES